ncbi:MAG: nucleotidyltransferase domain-containing protein [Candidatus Symbiothrix sp.]|nr:nucleotidyltransferase domain-containing protein [Candidatus Symbiothrix sp.]
MKQRFRNFEQASCHLQEALLFGSRAKGTYHSDSDLKEHILRVGKPLIKIHA